jgi:hypothetical protein
MRSSPAPHPTTEEHRLPSSGESERGRPMLLAAFPGLAALAVPASGEVVGRDWLSASGLADTEVSGRHLRFFRAGGRLQVEDAGSRNGTFVDGARLAPGERVSLDDGAVLRLGKTLLVHREAYPGDATPAPPLGRLIAPWGLARLRADLAALPSRGELNVLIEGETGTGKELVAEAVAGILGRGKPYAAVNVAGIPTSVFEGQLFGWKRGAYSGAVGDGLGVLRAHRGGAVFLDEIGELAPEAQVKILRLVENREILPVGEDRPVRVDVALIAATNRSLEQMVEQRAFRQDLLARFLVRLELPPLRERPEDLFALLQELRSRRLGRLDPATAEVEAVERLMMERWPANLRDLDRFASSLSPLEALTLAAVERVFGASGTPVAPTRQVAEQVLAASGNNQSEAARKLGISRPRLRRLLGLA